MFTPLLEQQVGFAGAFQQRCKERDLDPAYTLPCVIDDGTDAEANLQDPAYFYLKRPILHGKDELRMCCPAECIWSQNAALWAPWDSSRSLDTLISTSALLAAACNGPFCVACLLGSVII